ncbi:hypothetical protein KRR39_05740 [Nocardioides panacis]|uniref:SMP-30/Gluconolactonase/LRE-like region domain-containing protein n=1 Tax=Nocardioides panacis TaxID=2849501 RepID=A0A975T0K6_9ACTN|nr:hypothetical protein [Nocardioides panacis]QWZ09286.1 hypothetical protein KRR39_05740 [Nocardioides panacis]
MPGHRVVALLGALLLLVSCSASSRSDEPPPSSCPALHFDDVRGPVPSYVSAPLAAFPNDQALCRGLWLPTADRWLVPQGLALDGRTAWVSGYRWRKSYGDRPCRLLHVDLLTGRLLASADRLTGSVGDRGATFCRHGGALSSDRHGLWLAEADRLWLVDPARVGTGHEVLRVWRTERPVRGSAFVDGSRAEIALVSFSDRHAGRTRWYSFDDLLADGVTTLVAGRPTRADQAGATRTTSAVRRVQGTTRGPGGVWSTSSTSTCGMLVTPGGRRVAFAPGAEDLEFDGRGRVWAVLESGARSYQRDGRPLVPMLARFDARSLLSGPDTTCSW